MKPTQTTELLANIKATFVSFFSIFMFVALGVGVFLGISWAGPALQNAAQSAFDEGSFHNFQIQFPYGLTDDDLAKLSETEGVTQVEVARQSFQTAVVDGKDVTVKLQTVGSDIDRLSVVEGELPTKANEIALHAASASTIGAGVGDSVVFEKDAGDSSDDDGMKFLNGRTFKVTGIVNSPDYLAKSSETYGFSSTPSGTVDALAWVTASTWDPSAFQNAYPVVNVLCEGLSGASTFSGEYVAKSDEIEARLVELGDKLGTARYDDLHDQAQKKIDDAQAQIDEGKQKIAEGEKQLAEGRIQLEEQRNAAEAKLAGAYQQLMGYEATRRSAEQKLAAARQEVAEGEQALAEADAAKAYVSSRITYYRSAGNAERDKYEKSKKTEEDKAAYDAALDKLGAQATGELQPYAEKAGVQLPTVDHTNYFQALDAASAIVDRYEDIPVTYKGQTMTVREARAKLAEAQSALAGAESEYNNKVAQLNNAWGQYYAGQAEFQAMVAEAEQQLADGEARVAEAKAKVAENEPKLENAKEQLAAMTKYEWTVLPRDDNAGAEEVSVFSGVTNNLSISMAALFIIVGLLVSYSAVSRIVHEQVTQIGTKKALGLRSGEITLSFLCYSGIAVIAGAIVGSIVGYLVVEGIIGGVLGGMFSFGNYPAYFGIVLFLIVTALELLLVLGATWLACRGILKKHAVELLRGKEPPKAKTRFYEKWGIWDKLPLFTQTIVNNCVNDKRRMFSTIVGVAGCTALIVTAITLNNDVLKSYDRHYSEVYGFNDIVFVEAEPDNAPDGIEKALNNNGATTAQVIRKNYAIEQPGGGRATAQVIVPMDEESFANVYHVNPVSGGDVDLSQDGAWVTRAYADHFGAKVGDEVAVNAGDGSVHKVKILGFYDFWLTYHEMVMGKDYYEREFGASAPNVVLADTGSVSLSDTEAALSGVQGLYSITDDKDHQYGNFATFSSVSSAVVAIYIALSILMAIVVLLNLNVMFIDEKKRELIVLMINGFSVKDAKRYIYNDTIVLTAIGIICGLVLGCIMGAITVGAIEPSTATFVKDVDWTAVIAGVVGSALLALIMSVIALRRIPKFELTDINKF